MCDATVDDSPEKNECAPKESTEDLDADASTPAVDSPGKASALEDGQRALAELPAKTQMSKNQLKKQRRLEKMQASKKLKRKAERERRKERVKAAKARGETLGPDRKKLRSLRMADSPCHVAVVIDCSFDDLMTEKDISKLVKQVQHCYAINRRAASPFQYYVTSLGGKMSQRLKALDGYDAWDVNFREKSYLEEFEKHRLLYLSSESENVLETVSDDTVYVIGGLVDHNSQKGLCHRLAVENGVRHARLPLDKYMSMKTRRVLTIDHVFDILMQYYANRDWEKSFCTVLPKRKDAVPLGQCSDEASQESNRNDSALGDPITADDDGSHSLTEPLLNPVVDAAAESSS